MKARYPYTKHSNMEEQEFIEAIERSMQEQEREAHAMGREPQSATREEAIKQVEMLLKAKEEWINK